MFEAWYCPDAKRLTVYYIRDDKTGYPQFLVYLGNQWRYISAKHFEPIN